MIRPQIKVECVAEVEDAIPEFNAVQAARPGRVAQPPVREQPEVVGSYGLFRP